MSYNGSYFFIFLSVQYIGGYWDLMDIPSLSPIPIALDTNNFVSVNVL